MIGSFLTRGLVLVLGYAYPAYECYMTVEQNKPDIEQLRFWCQYWILVAMFTVTERIGDTFISWVPMYMEAKLAYFIYLWYPKTKGATYVYDSIFKPHVAKHETEINRNLSNLKTRAGDAAVLYFRKAATYGQSRFFEILQFVASQSTSKPRPAQNQTQKIVIDHDLNSQKRKNSIFRSVSKLKGIDSKAADKNRLTVVGDVDPVEGIKSIRKIGMPEIISVDPDTPILLKTPVFDKSFQTASDSLEDKPYASAETGLEQQLEETDLGGVGQGQGRGLNLKNILSWFRPRFLGHPSSKHNIEPPYPPEKHLRGNANIHEQIKYPHLEHTNPHLKEQLDLDNLDSPIWPSRQGKVHHGHPKGHTLDYLDLQVCRQGTQPEGHALDYLDLQVSARAYNNPDGQGSTEFPDSYGSITRFRLVSADNHPDGQGSTEFPYIYRSSSNYAAARDFRDDIYGKDESGTSPKEERTTQELEKVILIPPLDLIDSIASQVSVIHTLDLSFTNIKSLPEFICKFISLRVFNLKGCQLLMELVPEIGDLLNLEELDLEGTEIIYLPKQIAKLVNLKSLKFTLCGSADQFQETKRIGFVIPRKAFSNLLQLNELSIDVNPHGDWWNTEVKTVIDDLHCLQELKILRLYIPTVDLFGYLIQHIKLLIYQDSVCFRFTVGHHERLVSRLPEGVLKEFDDFEKFKKGLKFTSGEGMSIEITNALQHMDAFLLERHWSINNLLEFGLKSTEKLKCCILSECNELQTLIDTKQHPDYDGTVLGSLQHLSIHYMKNMQKIWRGPVTKGSLSNLKSLALYSCVSLTTVFKIDMLPNLTNLEELRIEDCPKIKTLASSSFSDDISLLLEFLPKLKSMLLLELPNLRCISSGLSIAPTLERLVILYCPNLKKLSRTEIFSIDLQVLKGTKGWWDALKWYESDVTEAEQNYLTSKFIPLREDEDLEEQFLRD